MTLLATPRRPRGFTLIELLVVLAIIGILIGLLIPAIAGAVRAAKAAAVQAEINAMTQALADFKSKFGDYPPSRVVLDESGASYTGVTTPVSGTGQSADVTLGQLSQRTVTAFRKFWPRVVFYGPSGSAAFSQGTGWYDFNGNGMYDGSFNGNKYFVVQGPECLVFFLGGIPLSYVDSSGNAINSVTGFGKSPTNPFTNNKNNANTMYNANRTPPLFEFNAGRLVPNTISGMLAYTDSLNAPPSDSLGYYAYFSTNLGQGYDPNDFNIAETDNSTTPVSPITLNFIPTQPVYNSSGQVAVTASPSPNPYTTSPPTFPITSPPSAPPVVF